MKLHNMLLAKAMRDTGDTGDAVEVSEAIIIESSEPTEEDLAFGHVSFPNAKTFGQQSLASFKITGVDAPVAESVGKWAFGGCSSLTSVDLPAVESVDTGAFNYCSSLTSVNLPAVKSIGEEAFSYCSSLTNVKLPAVESIGFLAFRNCSSLTMVDTSALMIMADRVFEGCYNLQALILRSTSGVVLCEKDGLSGVLWDTGIANGTGYVYVPKSLVEQYKNNYLWAAYSDQIRAIEDYPDVCGVSE